MKYDSLTHNPLAPSRLSGNIEVSRGKQRHAGTYMAYRDIPVMTGGTGEYIKGNTGAYREIIKQDFRKF